MSQAKNPFHILGAGLDPAELTPTYRELAESADVLVGGGRLLDSLPFQPAKRLALKPPLENILAEAERLRSQGLKVVILADGDPGFYGIGARLLHEFGRENVLLYPNVTVLQAAAAKLKLSWQDIETVSLHGRSDPAPLFGALTRRRLVGVYTDKENGPNRIAGLILDRGGDDFRLHIFEDLAGPEERIRSLLPSEAASAGFSELNFILVERSGPPEVELAFGLDDEVFLHQGGLLTKKEVRAVGLAALRPGSGQVIWDLGAGSGSVAIEAAAVAPGARIIAVEEDESRVEQIRANVRRTGALCVETVFGQAPACLSSLPDPDRIFIGGGLGRSRGLLASALERLRPGGRLVAHLVLLQSLQQALDLCREKGHAFELTQAQISRAQPLAGDLRLAPLSPVFILTILA